jgi:predicted outer membrane repeat protein
MSTFKTPMKPLALAISLASTQSHGLCFSDQTVNAITATDDNSTTTFAEAVAAINTCNAESSSITIDETFADSIIANNQQMDFGPNTLTIDNASLTISGPEGKRPRLYVSKANNYSLYISESGSADIKNLELYGGNNEVSRTNNAIYHESGSLLLDNVKVSEFHHDDGFGGPIRSHSNLTIKNSEFFENTSVQYDGGAIRSDGPLTIEDSTFSKNQAPRGGAIRSFEADLTIVDSIFDGNKTTDGQNHGGGAVLQTTESNTKNLTITGSTFKNNSAYGGGGAVHRQYTSGTVLIDDSHFESNTSQNWSGGNGDAKGGAIYLEGTTDSTISNTTFTSNTSNHRGGALYITQNDTNTSVTVTDSEFDGNTVNSTSVEGSFGDGNGGAIYIDSEDTSTIAIQRSMIENNSAANSAGAIYMSSQLAQILEIENSTISNNSSTTNGGALYIGSGNATLKVDNSTIAYNTTESGSGSAIHMTDTLVDGSNISHSTIVKNTANSYGAIKADGDLDTLEITHTIIAANSGTQDSICTTEASVGATITYSFVDGMTNSESCAAGLVDSSNTTTASTYDIKTDLLLSDLADNGGPTQTFMPMTDSPVVNAGDANIENAPTTDQRGSSRIQEGVIDIGAVETGTPPVNDKDDDDGFLGLGSMQYTWLALLSLVGLRRKK